MADEPADMYELRNENRILKSQLEVLSEKGKELAKANLDALLKDLGLGESGKFLQQLLLGNEEMKKMLQELLSKGFITSGSFMPAMTGNINTGTGNNFGEFGDFKPPLPQVNVDGDIPQGFSFKFRSYLDVMDKDGRAGLKDPTKHDVAFLQLQLCEFMELLKRKDEELTAKSHETEHLYEKIRDYLLVQD